MTSRLELLARARAHFERSVQAVTANQWRWPTGCGEWTVGELASHTILATQLYVSLLDGASAEQVVAMVRVPFVAEEPVAEFAAAANALEAGFGAPGVLAVAVHHPAGDLSGDGLIGYAMVEWAVHGWDMARALGMNDPLDAELAEALYVEMRPVAGHLSDLGAFAPAIPAPTGASVTERLLALLGRAP